jgi:hypothetical protein
VELQTKRIQKSDIFKKPTTAHISKQIITEVKELLKHTDWNIVKIDYSYYYEESE